MISTRYALSVAILLALASIPTVIHSYFDLTIDDGVSIKEINLEQDNFTSSPSKRNAGYGEETFGSEDWIERIYTNDEGKSIRLFIAKGYDHKRLYHHPELALSHGKDLGSKSQIRLSTHPELIVNTLRNNTQPQMAAFVLLYEGQSIDNPILHQVMDSFNLLINPRRPITLFYVSDDNASNNTPFNETAAASILTKAVTSYQNQSSSSPAL